MRTAARLIAKQVVFFYKTSFIIVAAVRELVLIGIHTDRDSVVEEMEALVDVHTAVERRWNTDNILIMGDMNVDCKYASGRARESLTLRTDPRFTWLIEDDVDTTTTSTDCAYDRCVCAPLLTCSVSVNRRLFIGRASVWL